MVSVEASRASDGHSRLLNKCATTFLVGALVLMGHSTIAQAATKSINESSNKKVITVKVGTTFSIVLNSTYWQFDPLKSTKAITEVAQPLVAAVLPSSAAPAGCAIAGSGCGTVTWKFKARAIGTALISATRSSCGEALRCSPENASYSVTIKIVR